MMGDQENAETHSSSSLMPVFFTILVSYIGRGIVLPLFLVLLLDERSAMFAAGMNVAMKKFLLGVLLAFYPMAEFFSSPILGALSDRLGRKKIFLLSMLTMLTGYLIMGIGVLENNFVLLLLGTFIAGCSGGNSSIAYAIIVDISPTRLRAKNFTYIPLAYSMGMILGPLMGEKLSNKSVVSWFDMATPFWAAVLLCLISLLLIYFTIPETLKTPQLGALHFSESMARIKKAFKQPLLRLGYLLVFFYCFAWSCLFLFLPLFLIDKFHLPVRDSSHMYIFMGGWIALFQFSLVQPLSKKFPPAKILRWLLPLSAAVIFLLILPKSLIGIIFIVPVIIAVEDLAYPNAIALISQLADEKSQGEVMGMNQSMQALSKGIAPLVAGMLLGLGPDMPIVISMVCALLAWVVFLQIRRKRLFKV